MEGPRTVPREVTEPLKPRHEELFFKLDFTSVTLLSEGIARALFAATITLSANSHKETDGRFSASRKIFKGEMRGGAAAALVLCWVALYRASARTPDYRPVVLMHGILSYPSHSVVGSDSTYRDNGTVSTTTQMLEAMGLYVRSIEIGDGYWDSILWNMPDQVQSLCQQISQDPKLQRGFNAMGYSQGALISQPHALTLVFDDRGAWQ